MPADELAVAAVVEHALELIADLLEIVPVRAAS
jgi:hypothetical protein